MVYPTQVGQAGGYFSAGRPLGLPSVASQYGNTNTDGAPDLSHEPENTLLAALEAPSAALLAALSAARKAARDSGMLDDQGNCEKTLETFAGSPGAVKQHLALSCPKLKAQSVFRTLWRTPGLKPAGSHNLYDLSSFAKGESRKLCTLCVENRPTTASLFGFAYLHLATKSAAEVAVVVDDLSRRKPSVLALRNELVAADKIMAGFLRLGIGTLPQLEKCTSEAVSAAHALLAELSRVLADEVPGFSREEMLLLASAAAATPAGSFRNNPNPKLRPVEALSDGSDSGTSLSYYAEQVFDRWFKEQKSSTDPVVWGAFEAARELDRNYDEISSHTPAHKISRWHVELDPSMTPKELLEANWRAVAAKEFELLFADWSERFQFVLNAPEATCMLVVAVNDPKRLAESNSLDRYGLMRLLVDRFPLTGVTFTGTRRGQVFAMRVPVAAARALDGYSSAGIEAASLEIMGDSATSLKIREVVETAVRFEGAAGEESVFAMKVATAVAAVM